VALIKAESLNETLLWLALKWKDRGSGIHGSVNYAPIHGTACKDFGWAYQFTEGTMIKKFTKTTAFKICS
jgi:hypothetical protein